jgi:hypothetical protein
MSTTEVPLDEAIGGVGDSIDGLETIAALLLAKAKLNDLRR